MKEFFVIGNQTSKSLSPLIFNYWFKKYKINARYKFVQVKEVNFEEVLIKKIKSKKVYGFNVTTPYKKKIIKYLDIKNNHTKNIGAANCVCVGKKLEGINTDWLGYLNSIKNEKITKNKKILIFGFGGASQAIFYGLLLKGYKKITVFNRSKKLIKFKSVNKYTKAYAMAEKNLKDADLIINTTPTNPLNKKQTKIINKKTIISDIVYTPKETQFLKGFKENKKIYGITMLVEQAIPCFHKWFGFNPKIDKVLLKKLNNKIK
ncbi:shikimate dehydrogenase [Pelagibacteraceae bacterium]|nr:shikimate dehydrogenase [Pelagibacteraceae bacterium]